MNYILENVDWLNVLVGASFTIIASLIITLIKGLYLQHVSSKDLPYQIRGTWYSAEFDEKGFVAGGDSKVELDGVNTFIKVKISRKLGNKFIINSIDSVEDLHQKTPTKWKVTGRIVNSDTLVGTWKSKIKHSIRHGTCILKFIDQGRAVGFWSGIGERDYPVYGYWILSNNENDIKILAETLLRNSNFKSLDLSECNRLFLTPIKKVN